MMKRILLGFPAFFVAFLVGLLFFEPVRLFTASTFAFLTEPVQRCSPTSEGNPAPGFSNLPDFASTDSQIYPIQLFDLFENGSVFRSGKITPDPNTRWFGLFENNGASSIEPVQIEIASPWPSSSDLQVKINDQPTLPVFIFSGEKAFNPGTVTTLYHRPSKEEVSLRHLPLKTMSIGYIERFNLNNVAYELRVVPGATANGTKLNVLVLESKGKSQTLVYNRHYDRADRIGDLLWVGDLDGDQKLDLYFDDFDFGTGNFGSNLFLSSEADPGSLVKQVSFFESLKH